MGVEIRVYVEGGGKEADCRAALRVGLSQFLDEVVQAARKRRIGWTVVACGGRDETRRKFMGAARDHPEAFCILLVDSEGPVSVPGAKQHLTGRDPWDLSGVDEDQVHLMVQTMEAWLVADREALAAYYGQRFNGNALPATRNVEDIPKDQLESGLLAATRDTQKGEYHKTRHAPQLLARLDPSKVRAAAPHCDRLFLTLAGLLDSPA